MRGVSDVKGTGREDGGRRAGGRNARWEGNGARDQSERGRGRERGGTRRCSGRTRPSEEEEKEGKGERETSASPSPLCSEGQERASLPRVT
jgi:hypothetical protein